MYTIEQVSPKEFKGSHITLNYEPNPEYGTTIRIQCSDQTLYLHIQPDYKDEPKIYIALK